MSFRYAPQLPEVLHAHRPSTIRTADRIVVLSNGRVVDNGSYAKLLTTNGPFAALVRQGLDKLE